MERILSKLSLALACLSAATMLSGCATIFGYKSNSLHFSSSQQALVLLDGDTIGTAPGKIVLPAKKIQHGSKLRIEAQGMKPLEYTLLRKPHAAYVAADMVSSLMLVGIPMMVDFGTGNVYRPVPRKISYELEPVNSAL